MMPGVLHIAGTGADVKPVDEVEMAAIKLVVQSGLRSQPCQFPKTGRRVRVVNGVLSNLEGILADSKNGIVIGISLLKRGVLVELGEATQVVQPTIGANAFEGGSLTSFPVEPRCRN